MKRVNTYLIATIICIAMIGYACKEDQVVGPPEEVLPGLWKIKSVTLTDYEDGVTYLGHTFFNDTLLFDIGNIEIPFFSPDSIEAIDLEKSRVPCVFEMGGGQMDVSINSLFPNGSEWRMTIWYNGPDGSHPVDTPVEEFYSTSHVFNNLYTLEILDQNNVQLNTSNDVENHVITMRRN